MSRMCSASQFKGNRFNVYHQEGSISIHNTYFSSSCLQSYSVNKNNTFNAFFVGSDTYNTKWYQNIYVDREYVFDNYTVLFNQYGIYLRLEFYEEGLVFKNNKENISIIKELKDILKRIRKHVKENGITDEIKMFF